MTTKVALYCRVSTTEQFPENQVKALSELAERSSAAIVATFIDKGVSGVKKDRDALNQMLAAARARKFNTLYAISIDRLSRSVKHLIPWYERRSSGSLPGSGSGAIPDTVQFAHARSGFFIR